MTAAAPPDLDSRMPTRTPGWWCWRCSWWQTEMEGRYRPQECGECAPWSRERHLTTDTLTRVLVTVEVAS